MRIRVTLVVDLDPEKWAQYQGCPREDVRENVRDHILYSTQASVFLEESDAEVSLAK